MYLNTWVSLHLNNRNGIKLCYNEYVIIRLTSHVKPKMFTSQLYDWIPFTQTPKSYNLRGGNEIIDQICLSLCSSLTERIVLHCIMPEFWFYLFQRRWYPKWIKNMACYCIAIPHSMWESFLLLSFSMPFPTHNLSRLNSCTKKY